MKQIVLTILMVALLAIGASAIQISNPTLGGEKQDRVKNVATTFTITNNNTATFTNIAISAGAGANNAKYALSFSGIPASLGPGASISITVNGTIPLDHPGVDSDLKVNAVKIGTVTVTGDVGSTTDSVTTDILMQAVNQLRIKKARVDCDTKSQSVDDGDRVKNLKPGMDCTLDVQVENQFDDNDRNNQKIGDINFDSVDLSIDSSDSDIDVSGDDNLDNLNANDDDTITADLQVDDEANDGTVSIDIHISGRDDNGALHGEARTFRMEVNRITHDLQIRRIELSPQKVENCEASAAKLSVNVLNQGKRDEKKAVIEVTAADLSFSKRVEDIQLDKDDSTSAAFDIAIPKGSKEGVVRVDVKTYFDTTAPSNSGSVDLAISKCSDETKADTTMTQDETKKQTTVVVPQQPVIPAGQSQAAPKKQTSFTEGKAYVGLLAVLSVLIAAAIVALVVIMVRKKRDN